MTNSTIWVSLAGPSLSTPKWDSFSRMGSRTIIVFFWYTYCKNQEK